MITIVCLTDILEADKREKILGAQLRGDHFMIADILWPADGDPDQAVLEVTFKTAPGGKNG